MRAAVAALLVLHAGLLAWSARIHAPTWDEPAHVVAGLAHLRGDFSTYRVNPPLPDTLAAIPVQLAGARTDWTGLDDRPGARPEFGLAQRFIAANGSRTFDLVTLARWAAIPWSLIGGLTCFAWASRLHGDRAGLLALLLWCASPAILGHGALVTADVAGASLGALAAFSWWRTMDSPTWRRALFSGVALGAALLARTTNVVVAACMIALTLAWTWGEHRATRREVLVRLAACLGLALLCVNAGYRFDGTLRPLGTYSFVSPTLAGPLPDGGTGNRFADTILARVPVPLPEDFVLGADTQSAVFDGTKITYARGRFQEGGRWWFYPYGLALKIPLGTWLLAGLALLAVALGRAPWSWRDDVPALLPAVATAVFVMATAPTAGHVRYVLLPVLPYLVVFASRVAEPAARLGRAMRVAAGVGVAWTLGAAAISAPHWLSYVNELGGGRDRASFHFIDSNVDWGQDLLALARWAKAHPEARPLHVAYFGSIDPRWAGLETTLPPDGAPRPGWHAVSVTALRGLKVLAPRRPGDTFTVGGDYTYFQRLEPVARIGWTILIYHVPEGAPPG